MLLLLLRDAAAEEEKEEVEEGKQEQQQLIIRARLGFRPSVRPSVCVCVFSLSPKEECCLSPFFWNFDMFETKKNKITHIDCVVIIIA